MSQINISNKNSINFKSIICPECGENAIIKIEDFKINLFGCKNGHNIKNILLENFEKTQKFDNSKIICGQCKEKNKSNSNEFFYCFTCKINVCSSCKKNHDKNHNIINYDKKENICYIHNEKYIKHCNQCKLNICMFCESSHKNHDLIYFGDLIPDINKINNIMKKLSDEIDNIKLVAKNIIDKLNRTIKNIEIYYKIYDLILNYYKKNSYNFEILENISHIDDNVFNNISQINYDFKKQLTRLEHFYNKMTLNDQISLIYDINENDKKEGKVKIFGKDFVNNNKNICKIIYENKEFELSEYFSLEKLKTNWLDLKLKGIEGVTDMSNIFNSCNSLSSLSDLSKWDTKNILNMSYLFYGCSELKSIPDISKFNTSNVIIMSGMFYNCKSLLSLPDISKWDTSKVIYLGGIYRGNLSPVPLLYDQGILSAPKNEMILSGMFYGCSSLLSLPDISKWNLSNVDNICGMFCGCKSLSYIPNISKWDTSQINDMSMIFAGCKSLENLPDISKWKVNKVKTMAYMFSNCESLSFLPDISKWNTSNIKSMSEMFKGCMNSLKIPSKFKR